MRQPAMSRRGRLLHKTPAVDRSGDMERSMVINERKRNTQEPFYEKEKDA